ncbi:hypothetical protein [Magnetospirillum fulvum]|uniref:Outer membrane protein beta-barrel domain-containing protein n=1 Tax=Magnetospirillum fulvum MGU-K5 TaxID=1316936 RepID=S9TV71_MAGFU|nr:hypothetical protein [Magnetospirillum fulvum]EPY02365.1 hypothetical protein K678_06340 [Magnetospirillum fulvum MGU-K5]
MQVRNATLIALAALGATASAALADGVKSDAAVSAPSATVMAIGGSASGKATGGGAASIALPVTDRIGVQVDGALTNSGGTGGMDAGLHLFTRDPDAYLAGGTFEWSRFGSTNAYRYGVELAAYLGDFTLGTTGGIQRGGANHATTTAGYAAIQADYYVFDTLKTSVSYGGYSNYRAVLAEVEWQPAEETPFSLFTEAGASVAHENRGIVLAGMRYTFGAPKSTIKDRDRHGDPEVFLQSGIASSNLMGNTKAFESATTPAPQPAPRPHDS